MPRPKKNRIVKQPPILRHFKPTGIPRTRLDDMNLSLDEFEAIRLADHLGMDHNDASEEMEISRPTFSRLIEEAHKKIAEFLIRGANLTIDGGNIHFRNNIMNCRNCGHMFNTEFNNTMQHCPNCGSDQLTDLAGGYGHGRCCGNKH